MFLKVDCKKGQKHCESVKNTKVKKSKNRRRVKKVSKIKRR